MLTGGVHLLDELWGLLLQGVQAVQMDLAFLLPKLLLLCLLHMVVVVVLLLLLLLCLSVLVRVLLL